MIISQPPPNKLLDSLLGAPDGALPCFLEIGFDISYSSSNSGKRKQVQFAQWVELCPTYLEMEEVLFGSPKQSGWGVVWWPYKHCWLSFDASEEPHTDWVVPEARVSPSNCYMEYTVAFCACGLLKIRFCVHMNTQSVLEPGLYNVNSTCRGLTQVPLCQHFRPVLRLLYKTKLTFWIQMIKLKRLAYSLGPLPNFYYFFIKQVIFILSKQISNFYIKQTDIYQCLLYAWPCTRSWSDKALAAEAQEEVLPASSWWSPSSSLIIRSFLRYWP